jgi:hypothetical protein
MPCGSEIDEYAARVLDYCGIGSECKTVYVKFNKFFRGQVIA